MTQQDKVDVLRRITAGYALLTGGYDARRNAYVWNCGNRAAGEALSGKLCASMDGYHLRVANPDGGTAFTFNGPNGERLVLSLDTIFDKTA
jgi:hypothetical protein